MERLPDQTILRLSRYRQVLFKYQYLNEPHIHSSDLARIMKLTPEQVRRDLMLMGCQSVSNRKGYNVMDVLKYIRATIDPVYNAKAIIIGVNSIPHEVIEFFQREDSKLNFIGAFDITNNYKEDMYMDLPCYTFNKLGQVISENNAGIAVFAEAAEYADQLLEILIKSGIKGIINISGTKLSAPEGIYIENIDIISTLEKIIYLTKE